MNADGSGQRNLTHEWGLRVSPAAALYGFPVWSPDWRRVAFVEARTATRPLTARMSM